MGLLNHSNLRSQIDLFLDKYPLSDDFIFFGSYSAHCHLYKDIFLSTHSSLSGLVNSYVDDKNGNFIDFPIGIYLLVDSFASSQSSAYVYTNLDNFESLLDFQIKNSYLNITSSGVNFNIMQILDLYNFNGTRASFDIYQFQYIKKPCCQNLDYSPIVRLLGGQ